MIWIAISLPLVTLALAVAIVPLVVAMVTEQKVRAGHEARLVPTQDVGPVTATPRVVNQRVGAQP